jgi:hypothetical protein
MGIREARKPVRWHAGSFTAIDDGRAQLVLFVTTDPGGTAVCSVQMLNAGLTEVGRLDVTVGPSPQGDIRAVATVPTFELATSGKIRGCVAR